MNNIPSIIEALCKEHNAYVKIDDDGNFAVCRRHYDDNYVPVVRYAPDPSDFHPLEEWIRYGSALIN